MLFQPSARTGALFLVLLGWQSAAALLMCLVGVFGATLGAWFLEGGGRAWRQGEGGFNGGLLALALVLFHEFGAPLLVIAGLGGAATAVLRAALLRLLAVPPFTAPFVVLAWPALALSRVLVGPAQPLAVAEPGEALLNSASQVLFQQDPLMGALVFAALWLHSARATLWVLAAALLAWLVATMLALPGALMDAGLLGYNALILAAALQQRTVRASLFVAGVAASVCLSALCFRLQVPPLSAPFVLCAWAVIGVQALLARRVAS